MTRWSSTKKEVWYDGTCDRIFIKTIFLSGGITIEMENVLPACFPGWAIVFAIDKHNLDQCKSLEKSGLVIKLGDFY